jgi:hypothetical protein
VGEQKAKNSNDNGEVDWMTPLLDAAPTFGFDNHTDTRDGKILPY